MAQRIFENMSLVDMLIRSRNLYGEKTAMKRFNGEVFVDISYNQFAGMAIDFAKGLQAMGLKNEDKVAILSENRPEWGVAYLGTLAAGCINVPLDALLKIAGWSHIIRDSKARVLVVSQNFLPELEQIFDDLPNLEFIVCMDKPSYSSRAISFNDLLEKGKAFDGEIIIPDPDNLAAILYTSGTTGQSKGVMLTHQNIVSNIEGVLSAIKLYDNDNFISVLPIHHTFECTGGFLTPLAGGACITYARGLASKLIIEDIKNNQATIILGVPLLFEKMHAGIFKAISKKPPLTRIIFKTTYGISRIMLDLLKSEAGKKIFKGLREKAGLSSLRLMVAGGAPMPPEVAKAFNLLGFTFIQGYGLTETSPVLTLNTPENRKDASIGQAVEGAEIKIIDSDNRGIGHIIAKGPMVMKGYYENPEATAEVIKDGWFYTGDSGWVDDDGFYYIAGRLKNVIVTPAGKNVYPEEIEAELNKSPYVLESIVLGRALGDQRGEEIEAILVPDYEFFDAIAADREKDYSSEEIEKVIKEEVAEYCKHLPDFKKVKYIQVREEEFEKTSTKKIKRYLFKQKTESINGK
jgi:long-chain acyl-CoA synthetase